jgi:hypothetical protein
MTDEEIKAFLRRMESEAVPYQIVSAAGSLLQLHWRRPDPCVPLDEFIDELRRRVAADAKEAVH